MLSNTEQSAISAFSILLIGLGAVASRVTSPLLAIGLIIAGAIGLGLQEAEGALQTSNPIAGLSNSAQALLTLIAYSLVAVGAATIPLGHMQLSEALLISGAAGAGLVQFLGAKASGAGSGISNEAQAIGQVLGALFLGVGGVSLASGSNDLGIVLTVVGVLGASLTQLAGSASTAPVATVVSKTA